MYAELLISSTLIHWLSLCISLRKARCIIHFKSCLNTLNSNNIQKTEQNSSQVHPVTSAHPRHCSVSWTLQTSNQLKLWMPGSLFLRAWEETDSKIKKKIITSPSCHKHTPTPLFCLLNTADIKSVKVVNAWIFVSENMKWDRLKKKKKVWQDHNRQEQLQILFSFGSHLEENFPDRNKFTRPNHSMSANLCVIHGIWDYYLSKVSSDRPAVSLSFSLIWSALTRVLQHAAK